MLAQNESCAAITTMIDGADNVSEGMFVCHIIIGYSRVSNEESTQCMLKHIE